MDLMFAQTREDPTVEINALEELDKSDLKILMVSSAGDTLCNLIVNDKLNKIACIDCIDLNEKQLELSKLKFKLIQEHVGSEVHDALQTINQSGKFETLFRMASKDGIDVAFQINNLIEMFGENAVKYSMNKSFVDHFTDVLSTYRTKYSHSSQNYFYNQFVNDCYDGDMPIYLGHTTPVKTSAKISFIQDNILNVITESKSDQYDMIQLSNITDWTNPELFVKLLDKCMIVLTLGGKLIMRRLNSDTILRTFIEEHNLRSTVWNFEIKGAEDKSHFYTEVLVLTKVFKCSE